MPLSPLPLRRAVRCAAIVALLMVLCPVLLTAQASRSNGDLAPSRADIFLGYSYWHPLSGSIDQRTFAAIQPGVVLDATYYFGRYLGAQVEGGGFPGGTNDSIYTAQAGPVFRYSIGRFSPFIHALGGGAKVAGPASQPSTWGWALTGGLGLDYVPPIFSNRIAVRPIQADYQFSHTDYGPIGVDGLTGGLAEVRAYRLSAGVVLRFGAGAGVASTKRPLMYGCVAEPQTIFAGDPVTVSGTFISSRQTQNKRLVYTWASSGGHIVGQDENATVATSGLLPGDYFITGHLVAGKHTAERADCTATFTVEPPPPPTLNCSASPASVAQGGEVLIRADGSSPQNRPLRYDYSASAGEIVRQQGGPLTSDQQPNQQQGQPTRARPTSSNTAILNTKGISAGLVNIACTVTDDNNQSAHASAQITVIAPAAASVTPRELCTLSFERDLRRPARVNNEGKACLDDIALSLNRDPGAKLTITGERVATEGHSLAAQRAANAKTYLTQEKGISPSRIDLRTGTAAERTAHTTLFPYGAPPDLSDGASMRTNPDSVQTYRSSPGTLTTPDSLVMPPLGSGVPNPSARRHKKTRRHRAAAPTTPPPAPTAGP